ncbi:MAG TPA: acyltransferase [Candidatus Dormibacteraeota bacterium]|nr:acyltransferase [Candidatus Dormibacteraeota bacterium]
MPELDAVRGIAILGVVLYHAFYWKTDLTAFPHFERLFITAFWPGRLGVNLFFVLSGFLITGLLLDSRNRIDYFRRFYIRRGLWILPAYLVVLTILVATHYTSIAFIIFSLAYLSNLTPLFGVAIGYPVLWSLAVEEHFYFVWPAIVRWFKAKTLLYCSLSIIVLSPILRLLSFYIAQKSDHVSYEINDYTWNSSDGLACGAVLAIVLREYAVDEKRLLRLCYFCILLSVIIWSFGLPFGIISRLTPFGTALQVVPWHLLFVALLGICIVIGAGPKRYFVQVPFLKLLNEISYGLYLIHVLVFDGFDWFAKQHRVPGMGWGKLSDLIVRFAYVGCLSMLLAYLSRRQFEDRFLTLKSRFS